MTASTTIFRTEQAARYRAALAKHFSHKIAVRETETEAVFPFAAGTGRAEIVPEGLALFADADSEEERRGVEQVLESHLQRFAFREEFPPLVWSSAT
ncbi:DUF2218 domain-containing protein [Fulvimarina endophytica]|uniref:DUF2218 domain-containing protein n=1 Tax=Fulvimarina endophytica TaxID=2293836 RepID=A0A371XA79_9HYPH|nr:DUF2218 domain-containing protein [Fulvimarina endophytica]RFC66135.1 DUF2218 domain-containing protein [Fulvimarina endophytica]